MARIGVVSFSDGRHYVHDGIAEFIEADGSATSGRQRDQRMSSGAVIFASHNRPSRQRNADRLYSAEARHFFRDLNRGYLARFSQNATNAFCKCRKLCRNGTDDTSFKKARSWVCFHSVSNADVCT